MPVVGVSLAGPAAGEAEAYSIPFTRPTTMLFISSSFSSPPLPLELLSLGHSGCGCLPFVRSAMGLFQSLIKTAKGESARLTDRAGLKHQQQWRGSP